MRYNLKHFKLQLKKNNWYIVEETKEHVYMSTSKEGYLDKLAIFCYVLPEERVVLHYGIWAYLLSYIHMRAIDGYVKTKYGKKFRHYACDYDQIVPFMYGKIDLKKTDLQRIY